MVSDKEAGWYPDPDGENRQRYWDGDQWSTYYTPLPPQAGEEHNAATATADYPYLANAHVALPQPATTASLTRSAGSWGVAADAAHGSGTAEFSGSGKRGGPGVWILGVASLLVVAIIGALIWAFIGLNDPDNPPFTNSPDPTDSVTGQTITDAVTLGTEATASLDRGDEWVGTFTITDTTTIALDVRADDDTTDLTMDLWPAGGSSAIASNDDRSPALANLSSGRLNPFITTVLEAGDYEIRISERDNKASSFALFSTIVSDTIAFDSPTQVSLASGENYMAQLQIPTSGSYTIAISGPAPDGSDGDPVLFLVDEFGNALVSDDAGSDDRNPVFTTDLNQGTYVLIVAEYTHAGVDFTVEVTAG